MLVFDFTEETHLELEVKCSGKSLNFHSAVALVKEDFILIKKIMVDGRTIGFSNKCSINLLVNEDDILYAWKDVKVTLVRYDGSVYHKIENPKSVKEPHNRRGSYRVFIGEDMHVFLNAANGQEALTVLVKDLSESGIGFITKEELDIGRIVRIKFRKDRPIINLSATLVRKESNENLGNYTYGGLFLQRSPELSRYIAKRQREYLKEHNYRL